MKVITLPDDDIRSKDPLDLEHILNDRMMKLRKINALMKSDMQVQKALADLEKAKTPFKRAASKWKNEIEAIELELKTRNVKFDIDLDEIYELDL